ncbi:hypothetical protein AAFF_G00286570 [Aldrovandia affinis]|uniref:Uncharacterized protein n=1 Tax=Aldrovandia affinis TaxID=143900 RepID=A0AAD7TAP6_9TELE|nr:hypothetical protein AAFF_G00286570 [Aldrovandia affinis]
MRTSSNRPVLTVGVREEHGHSVAPGVRLVSRAGDVLHCPRGGARTEDTLGEGFSVRSDCPSISEPRRPDGVKATPGQQQQRTRSGNGPCIATETE